MRSGRDGSLALLRVLVLVVDAREKDPPEMVRPAGACRAAGAEEGAVSGSVVDGAVISCAVLATPGMLTTGWVLEPRRRKRGMVWVNTRMRGRRAAALVDALATSAILGVAADTAADTAVDVAVTAVAPEGAALL